MSATDQHTITIQKHRYIEKHFMKYISLAAATVLTIAACKKSKTDPPAASATNNSTTTMDTPAVTAFTPWTDTFKGSTMRPADSYMVSDSVIFFYVNHFVNDSFEITSNATFQQDDKKYDGYPVQHRIKFSKKGRYEVPSFSRIVEFKQDSILFTWTYYYELKMPSGGVHSSDYKAYGKKTNTR
jgi:hypothetical protein